MGLSVPRSRGAIAAVAVAVVLAGGGAVVAVAAMRSDTGATNSPTGTVAVAPRLAVDHLQRGHVPWSRPVTITARDGVLRSVQVLSRSAIPLDGRLSHDDTRWTSTSRLIPATDYRVDAIVAGSDQTVRRHLQFRSTNSKLHLTALLSPGDGDVVGVGSPVIVHFSRPVPAGKRAAVEDRLAVSTTPSVVGAWHWMNDEEVHWRPPTYWKPGTVINVTADLNDLYVGGGIWGEGKHETSFRIGDSHISRVDVARHEMYVYDNGRLVRTMPISAGRTQYPTKNGVHITFEKSQVVTMDSATVGIPTNSPDGYYEKVYWDVRISYGGAFVHAAPWSVADQGITNVSHGCVNISPDNAIWFYNFSNRGDIVDVYNSTAAPDTSDPGMADWNMTWRQWVAGDAAPTAAARSLHPPLPRSVEPPAPGAASTSSGSSAPTKSPSPYPTKSSHH